MRRFGAVVFLILSFSFSADAQDRSYGRSTATTDRGIVATSHILASQAGARSWRGADQQLMLPSLT